MGFFSDPSYKMKVLLVASFLIAAAFAAPQSSKSMAVKAQWVRDIKCTVCTTAITKFDEWLTSDSTEHEIIEFVEQACSAVGEVIPNTEAACKALVESQLPSIIEGLVNDNLSPNAVCADMLGLC